MTTFNVIHSAATAAQIESVQFLLEDMRKQYPLPQDLREEMMKSAIQQNVDAIKVLSTASEADYDRLFKNAVSMFQFRQAEVFQVEDQDYSIVALHMTNNDSINMFLDAYREVELPMEKISEGIYQTSNGIYNLNDSTITMAQPTEFIDFIMDVAVQSYAAIHEELANYPELKVAVEASLA